MENAFSSLRSLGGEIINTVGCYCRAFVDGREVLLRWTGEDWVQL
jgi:hypothetical protein